MKRKKIIKLILLVILFICILNAKTFATSDFAYELDEDNNAIITAYNGNESDITIPSIIDGYNVKDIKDHAFDESKNNTNGKILKNVIISEGITSIGNFAFVGCTNLESVVLPETLTSLGDQTFIGCNKLNKINIPSKVTSFGFSGFMFQETGLQEIVIPDNIKNIPDQTFRICKELKKVVVYSDDVVYGSDVFQYCSEDLVLYGNENSTTQEYATQNNLQFKIISSMDEDIPVTSIELNKTSLSLDIGETANLSVTILPDNATDKSLNWFSSDPEIATVNNGKIVAKSVGTATITVSNVDNTKKATCNVNVTNENSNLQKPSNNVGSTSSNAVDKTVVNNKIPQAGVSNCIAVLLLALFVISIIMSILYKKYKI